MKLWERFKVNKNSQIESEEPIQEDVEDESLTDVLNLGWYKSESKNELQMAKISEEDRATHFYIVGASGTGKSKFLEFLIREDIKKGNGLGVIDPHGDLVEALLCLIEEKYVERTIYFNPGDPNYVLLWNPLKRSSGQDIGRTPMIWWLR